MNDWWAAEDAEEFVTRASVMVKQANDAVVHTQDEACEEKSMPFSLTKPGIRSVATKACACRNVNGELTQGENIADLGGVRLAHRAWKTYVGEGEPPVRGAGKLSRGSPRCGSSTRGRRCGGRT